MRRLGRFLLALYGLALAVAGTLLMWAAVLLAFDLSDVPNAADLYVLDAIVAAGAVWVAVCGFDLFLRASGRLR